MGWTSRYKPCLLHLSSSDAMHLLRLSFDTPTAAVRYAERNGYAWYIKDEEAKRQPIQQPKSYADNFRFSPGRLKLIRTK